MTDKHAPSAPTNTKRHWLCGGIATALSALLAACTFKPRHPDTTTSNAPGQRTEGKISGAKNPRAYRKDAASHLYGLHAQRIYQGKLPPLLYAVGVLEVNLGRKGEVRSFNWMRKPSHAPEVVREIEQMVRAAAPFPVAPELGYVTYTDTWLWHKSGRFQLDTLTEGQLDFSS